MVQAAPPSRTLDQVMCAIEDQLAQIAALIAQMSAGGLPLVYTLPGPADSFRVWIAQVTTTPVRLMPRNGKRLAFTIQAPSTGAFYVGMSRGDVGTGQAAPIQDTQFGLSNHVGEVWAAAVTTNVTLTLVEQWSSS